jgi:hypothetical protein
MKKASYSGLYVFLAFLILSCSQRHADVEYSWDGVELGTSQQQVHLLHGKGDNTNYYDDVYYVDYVSNGVQLAYVKDTKLVKGIAFYQESERFSMFTGEIVNLQGNISWTSTIDEIMDVYGHPQEHYNGDKKDGVYKWERIAYSRIGFRFEYGKLVRIGIYHPED